MLKGLQTSRFLPDTTSQRYVCLAVAGAIFRQTSVFRAQRPILLTSSNLLQLHDMNAALPTFSLRALVLDAAQSAVLNQ